MYIYNYIWNIYIQLNIKMYIYIYIQYPWIQLGLSFLTVDSWLCETRPLPLHLHLKAGRRSKHPKCQDPEIENIREPAAGWNLDILPTKVAKITPWSGGECMLPRCLRQTKCPTWRWDAIVLDTTRCLKFNQYKTSEFAYKIFMMRLMTVVFGHFLAMWLCSSPCHVCS